MTLLLRWNEKINLTATSDVHELLRRHIGESLFGAQFLPEKPGRLYDIGSGAGFPGIFLKLARPTWDLVLVESNLRKAAFLSEAVRELGLRDARVVAERSDNIPEARRIADVVVARALGRHADLLNWSGRALRSGGRVILWLGMRDAEILSKTASWSWDLPIPIPDSLERVILVGRSRSSALITPQVPLSSNSK
jgi:16S rRNA (guanine527-N7)-methyltransferase